MTRADVASGTIASESAVAAIGAPFTLSFASRFPGRAPSPIIRLRASIVMSSIRHSLSGDVVASRISIVTRCSEIRSSWIVHLADEADSLRASALVPLSRSRTSEKSNSVGPRRRMLPFAPTSEISLTRTVWNRNGR